MKIEPEFLQSKIDEIDRVFQPSTSIEQGELMLTNYAKWSKEVVPKQMEDWEKLKKLLRGTWGKLDWRYKGWIFNHYRAKFNWRGWGTNEGIAMTLAEAKAQ